MRVFHGSAVEVTNPEITALLVTVYKWMNFFVLKKRVRCTQITKKVK